MNFLCRHRKALSKVQAAIQRQSQEAARQRKTRKTSGRTLHPVSPSASLHFTRIRTARAFVQWREEGSNFTLCGCTLQVQQDLTELGVETSCEVCLITPRCGDSEQ
jgi:hypothetical protein